MTTIGVVYSSRYPDVWNIKNAIRLINQLQNQYILDDREDDPKGLETIDSVHDLIRKITRNESTNNFEYTVFIISEPFEDNWFSHEFSRCCFITTDSWNGLFSPPSVRFYLIYQIAQALLTFSIRT